MWVWAPVVLHVLEHANDASNACAQEDRLVGGARRGRDERETTSSLSFESDTERDEPAATGLGAWFRRSR